MTRHLVLLLAVIGAALAPALAASSNRIPTRPPPHVSTTRCNDGDLSHGCTSIVKLTCRRFGLVTGQNIECEIKLKTVAGKYESKVDHFTTLDQRTFEMRYYINDEFFHKANSTWGTNTPVFLYMGGESALSSGCVCGGFFYEMAAKHGALLVGLEHRFYGETLPFDLLETENLQYLSVAQALEDAGTFLASLLEQYPPGEDSKRQPPLTLSYPSTQSLQNAPPRRPVITVGGSYPGVLSALMRLRFPEIVSGALASSAPIQATTHFFEYESIGSQAAAIYEPKCIPSYNKAMDHMYELLKTREGRQMINNHLPLCKNLTDNYLDVDTLLYSWPYDLGGFMQYYTAYPSPAGLPQLCDSLWAKITANYTIEPSDPVTSLQLLAKLFTSGSCVGDRFEDFYSSPQFQDKKASSAGLNYRTWFWQKCSQVGYFRSGGNSKPFSNWQQGIPSDEFYSQLCEAVYQFPVYPDTKKFNNDYGGWNTSVTNVFFANGDLDGWHGLGVLYKQNDKQVVMLNRNYSHCQDMYGSSYEPTSDMKTTHKVQEKSMIDWINEQLGSSNVADSTTATIISE